LRRTQSKDAPFSGEVFIAGLNSLKVISIIFLLPVEDLVVRFIGFTAIVRVTVCGGDAFVPRKDLGKFQVAFGKIGHGDKVVAEVVNAHKVAIYASFFDASFDALIGAPLIAFHIPPAVMGRIFLLARMS
jgi:hypothetical protein